MKTKLKALLVITIFLNAAWAQQTAPMLPIQPQQTAPIPPQPPVNLSLNQCILNCAQKYKFVAPPPQSLGKVACGAFTLSTNADCAGHYCQANNGSCHGDLCVASYDCYGRECSSGNGHAHPLDQPSWCPNPPQNDYANCMMDCKLLT